MCFLVSGMNSIRLETRLLSFSPRAPPRRFQHDAYLRLVPELVVKAPLALIDMTHSLLKTLGACTRTLVSVRVVSNIKFSKNAVLPLT